MKKCSLCGGILDHNKRCTLCGLDNTKDDSQYKNMVNRSDCEGEPLTHVHTAPARPKRVTQETKAGQSAQVATLVKIIVIIVILFSIGSAFFRIVDNLAINAYDYSCEEEAEMDPYEYVNYDLPESGQYYSDTLKPGIYTVGVHIPEGKYSVEVVSGDFGYVEIHDYQNGIYLNETFGLFEEPQFLNDMRLYTDGYFIVSTGITVKITSKNVQSDELQVIENPLTDSVTVQQYMVAGRDFPAGVYDIVYEPSKDGEYGVAEYYVPIGEEDQTLDFSVGFSEGAERYRNVVFTEGMFIKLRELHSITLVPSEWITPQDIHYFYHTFY